MFDNSLLNRISGTYENLHSINELLTREQIQFASQLFWKRFGPNQLLQMDGRELLHLMHGRGRKDSLVYWLEFKNDEELPDRFGSIRGGPAAKFGLYSVGSDEWWLSGKGKHRPISEEQAIQWAIHQRQQLVKGSAVFEGIQSIRPKERYERLEQGLNLLDPWVIDTAWAHKYFTLLFPDLLDNYHTKNWQLFRLVKLLIVPPGYRRYANAFFFSELAAKLDIPLINLTYALNDLHGRPHKYWLIRHDQNAGDLESRMELAPKGLPDVVLESFDGQPPKPLERFTRVLDEEDIVIVYSGAEHPARLGVGQVDAGHWHVPGERGPYRRSLRWLTGMSCRREWFPFLQPHTLVRVLDLKVPREASLAVEAERHGLSYWAGEKPAPLRIEKIEIGKEGRLQNFTVSLPTSPQEYLAGINLTVLVGENGTGKTTILRLLSQLWEPPNEEEQGTLSVTYWVRGRRTEIGRRMDRLLVPTALPSRVIVSSYAAVERYPTASRPHSRVPYVYLGVNPLEEITAAHLPILRATYREDRSMLSSRERAQREAIERLLKMVDYGQAPYVKFLSAPLIRGQQCPDFTSLSASADELSKRLGLENPDPDQVEAVRRLLDYVSADPGMVGRAELNDYPGGVSGWLEDLKVARQCEVRVIEDLYFNRGHSWIPFRWLSSGEQSLLYRFFRILDEIRDDAVVIIDEPEVHLHPRWLLRFVDMLRTVFTGCQCHFLLATHSPLIAADLPRECIVALRADPETHLVEAFPMEEDTMGGNSHQILHQVFGIEDPVGQFTRQYMDVVQERIAAGDLDGARVLLRRMGESVHKFDLYRRIAEFGKPQKGNQ